MFLQISSNRTPRRTAFRGDGYGSSKNYGDGSGSGLSFGHGFLDGSGFGFGSCFDGVDKLGSGSGIGCNSSVQYP